MDGTPTQRIENLALSAPRRAVNRQCSFGGECPIEEVGRHKMCGAQLSEQKTLEFIKSNIYVVDLRSGPLEKSYAAFVGC